MHLRFIAPYTVPYEVVPAVAVRQMSASFHGGLLFKRLHRKREFQTDLTQAFIVLHDRELDFFESFLYQDKKDSPRGGERHSQLRLGT